MGLINLFSLAGISVRAKFGFLFLLAYFGYIYYGQVGTVGALLVVAAVIVTLLIHEFGHAFVARHYRLDPHIVLHGWGGYCEHRPARRNGQTALIIAGGPLAQLVAAGVAYAAVTFLGPIANPMLHFFTEMFILFSVFWALLNLIPIFPLDGGQLFRLLLIRFMKHESEANRMVHIVGIGLSAAVALVGFLLINSPMLGIFGVLWALENQRYLQQQNVVKPVKPKRSVVADGMLRQALAAFRQLDYHEARRIAFQARAEKGIEQDQLDQAVRIITVASAELEDWSEALDWSRRAPRTPDVFMARILALVGSGRAAAARAELEASDAPELPPVMMDRIRSVLAGT